MFGGLGNEITKDVIITDPMTGAMVNLGSIESATGFHLQPAVQFPLIMGTDGRVFAQGEIFGALAFYGFSDKIALNASQVSGSAKFIAAGFAMRGNFFVSERVPFALAPALGFGVGAQFFNLRTADGVCDVSSGLPTAFVSLDLAAKFELAEHHAFYFSPANFHFYLASLTDGGTIQPCGAGGMAVQADKAFGTDSARVNYGVDLGYMYQF
jgi:hypothetical protein